MACSLLRSSFCLTVLTLTAAAQEGPAPRIVAVTAVPARGPGLDIPPPPQAVVPVLSGHGLPPLPPGSGTLPQPDSPPSHAQLYGAAAPQAGQFTFFYNVDSAPTGGLLSLVTEPTVAINRDTAFQTGNWYAALSTDSGVTWTHVNPFTLFAAADGGFCCDQRTLYVPSHDASVWLLQYAYSATTRSGRDRVAFALGRAGLRNSAWASYDLTPQLFGFADHWLDFPDLAFTTTHVYGSTNVFVPGGTTSIDSVLWRAELNDFFDGGATNFTFYLGSAIGSSSYHFAASQVATMYAAGQIDTTTLRAYRWGAVGNIAWTDITVPMWSSATMSAGSPDGRAWAGSADGRVLGGYAGSSEYGFLWASAAITGRPQPFTRVARIRTSNNTLLAVEDIWNTSEAFLYPAAATNALGNVGFTVANGSSAIYPRTVAGIVDGYAPNFAGQTLYAAANGTHGPDRNRWGDYFAVAPHSTFTNTFVTIGKRQNGGPANANAAPHYMWFGRDDFTPAWVDLAVTSSPFSGVPITVGETDRALRKDGVTNFVRSYPPRQGYTLTAPAQHSNGGVTYSFERWVSNGIEWDLGQRTLTIDNIGDLADTAEARYIAVRTLHVDSTPARGVLITLDVLDRNNQGSSFTVFDRVYDYGRTVQLTAPDAHNGVYLRRWFVDGAPMPPRQRTISVLLDHDVTAVADYGGVTGTGTDWTDLSAGSPARPPARAWHAMAYDQNRDRVVLFGGANAGLTRLNDTWEYDGATWSQLAPATAPPARDRHRMVWLGDGRTLLFGGLTGLATYDNGTWAFDGATWTDLMPANAPSPRADVAMTYVESTGTTLLFGGLFNGQGLNDTWEFDGMTWVQHTPATSPPPLAQANMCFDIARQRVVLISRGAGQTQVWEYDFVDWVQVASVPAPAQRIFEAVLYDELRQRTVLFGGNFAGGTGFRDTWEWNGAVWTERIPFQVPSARYAHAFVYDSARRRGLLFGGGGSGGVLDDTWQYAYDCDVFGPGHPGGGLPITCTSPPRLGTSFCVQFPAATATGAVLLGLHLPLSPPVPLPPPLFCDTALLYTFGDIVLNTAGDPATKCLAIPADPALLWGAFTLQGVSVEAAACLRVTDGLLFVVQP